MLNSETTVHNEVHITVQAEGRWAGWSLYFQQCTYTYDDGGTSEDGYQFLWKGPHDDHRPHLWQARIASPGDLRELIALAEAAGWFPKTM